MTSVLPFTVVTLLSIVCVLAAPSQSPFHSSPYSPSKPSLLFPFEEPLLSSPRFISFVSSLLSQWSISGGVSIGLVHLSNTTATGEPAWYEETKGFGLAKLDGTLMSDKGDDLMGIASNSKLFATVAAGMLIHNESLTPRINWDTKVKDIFPEWGEAIEDEYLRDHADLVDLMSHRTGFPGHDYSYTKNDTLSSLIHRLKYLRMISEPRQTLYYNNIMYNILSLLPLRVVSTPIAAYMCEHVFEPLGMADTTYNFAYANATGRIADAFGVEKSTALNLNSTKRRVYPFYDGETGNGWGMNAGAGGVISSAKDATIWLKTLLLSGRHPVTGESIVPEDVVDRVTQGVTIFTPFYNGAAYPEIGEVVYGGGQLRGTYRGQEFIEHGGDLLGYHTQIIRFPRANLGLSIFVNDDVHGSELHTIIKWRIADTFFGMDEIDWSARFMGDVSKREVESEERWSTNREDAATLPFNASLESLSGRYWNPGYGMLDVCHVASTAVGPNSSVCDDPTGSFNAITEPGIPTLMIPMPNILWSWVSHFKLAHSDGPTFYASSEHRVPYLPSSTAPIPHKDEANYWWAESPADTKFLAEFVFDSATSMVEGMKFIDLWGTRIGRERTEIVFDRVV